MVVEGVESVKAMAFEAFKKAISEYGYTTAHEKWIATQEYFEFFSVCISKRPANKTEIKENKNTKQNRCKSKKCRL